jgi:hypothetical protein
MHDYIKNEWVSALRGGDYNQSAHHLRDLKGFDFFGVLCDVFQKDTGNGDWVLTVKGETNSKSLYAFCIGPDRAHTYLLPDVVEWAGLAPTSLYPKLAKGEADPMRITDLDGVSFEEFADLLETHEVV